MAANDSLLNVSQNFFTPKIVHKISDVIGQSEEKTKTGLMSTVPTFVSGMIDKGTTPDGAATLVDMVNTHNYESITTPDENKLSDGNEVVDKIFGSNLNNIVSKLVASTGLSTPDISKMLGLVAPVIMGVLGSKVKSEKLSSSGLMTFFTQQKMVLAGFSPNTSEYYRLSGQDPDKDLRKGPAQDIPWKIIILLSIALIFILFWWQAVQINSTAP
ncbi:MAG: DUF937 domain-containing protein [Bacteriovorax sp.]|nr:DUF937 domain-containing protein [Bacteriovorax sp.]